MAPHGAPPAALLLLCALDIALDPRETPPLGPSPQNPLRVTAPPIPGPPPQRVTPPHPDFPPPPDPRDPPPGPQRRRGRPPRRPPPPDERLLRGLLARYRPGVRPAARGPGGRVLVRVGLELAQLVSLDEKHEELTTKVYLDLSWRDPRLQWDPPRSRGGWGVLRVPAEHLWLPDLGLENNNDGEFGVSLGVRAVVTPDGSVRWRPPALYRSRCPPQVSHFPFDWQNCSLVFRSGSYGPEEVGLRLAGGDTPGGGGPRPSCPPTSRRTVSGSCATAPARHHASPSHEDVTFYLVIRRKPLFYIVNVLVPCVLITLLAVVVFYLPPDAGEKMTLSLFALLTLTVFLLLLADKVPATSLAVPLIGRYLTGTLVLLTLCVILSVGVLNLHHRSPATHTMPPWARRLLLQRLPPLLGLRPPRPSPPRTPPTPRGHPPRAGDEYFLRRPLPGAPPVPPPLLQGPPPPPELRAAAAAIGFIARHLREQQQPRQPPMTPVPAPPPPNPPQSSCEPSHERLHGGRLQLQEEWHVVALAVDRLFLWAFLVLTGGCALGTGLDAALHRPPPRPFP
ncbi:LOW QUALITY PROTEIN: acetylcholine receptor subunit beta [Haliaeetus albicilla]|uniref:LOW QUALITY PROTEIN: acetylcholine receptor subunit beta n=1 Tax=Haliaeetus albicilla TaxID=8969 RepID=UPI0037E8D94B